MYKRLAKLAEEVGLKSEDVLKYLDFEPIAVGSADGHNVGNAVHFAHDSGTDGRSRTT